MIDPFNCMMVRRHVEEKFSKLYSLIADCGYFLNCVSKFRHGAGDFVTLGGIGQPIDGRSWYGYAARCDFRHLLESGRDVGHAEF